MPCSGHAAGGQHTAQGGEYRADYTIELLLPLQQPRTQVGAGQEQRHQGKPQQMGCQQEPALQRLLTWLREEMQLSHEQLQTVTALELPAG